MMIMVTMRGERRGGMVMIKRIITMRIIMMFMVTVRRLGIIRKKDGNDKKDEDYFDFNNDKKDKG